MKKEKMSIVDANEAVASVAYRLSETIAIYPITPSSPMAELAEEWAARGKPNLWKNVPTVSQLQSEAGVAGTIHGALQGGTLATTFTASQGLLLMIPNMYKIAGELTSFCMHVTSRSLATHALSIFGDHSDVMACRQTGFALLCSNSVQEAQDLACIAHVVTLKARVPFLHFFDGFRTSHEINTITVLSNEELEGMVDYEDILAHRLRSLTPDRPVIRGTAQNPDVYFQAREAGNLYYQGVPGIVTASMDRFAQLTGRHYHLFDYKGDPEAERIVVVMGSGAETIEQTSEWLNTHGEKTGVVIVRLYRPFCVEAFAKVLPKTVKKIAVLDRTKEPGAIGEPLYLDVVSALYEAHEKGLCQSCVVIGGIYGLGSKEFSPAMAKAVFDELKEETPKKHFTVGITDDVTHQSLHVENGFDLENKSVFRGIFFGLGSDGTVGANKNTIKIIGKETDNYAQAYFVYDSKKSGGITVSHLRFGPNPIRAPYLIQNAQFIGCHQFPFVEKYDVLQYASEGAVFLLNSIYPPENVWEALPRRLQKRIVEKNLQVYVIDAYQVARECGMGARINTIMQTCFFAISGILPREEAIAKIKDSIRKTYGRKGEALVQKNFNAVDHALENLQRVLIPTETLVSDQVSPVWEADAPDFVKRVTAVMMANQGDQLPVSVFPPDGTWPTDTSRWEKRDIAQEIPVWDSSLCIQCNKCCFVCPHAAIRAKFYDPEKLREAPESFKAVDFRSREFSNQKYTLQVAPEDCTGCGLCVAVCPAKDKNNSLHKAINMEPQAPLLERERQNYNFFLALPHPDPTKLDTAVKSTQFREPLFEYSGACSGCGETPYIKLLTQLFGDRLIIANATGCSSIYGGNLPTTPYAVNAEGRGPAWANSLFEDNAEFGLGLQLSLEKKAELARHLLKQMAPRLGEARIDAILKADQTTEVQIEEQRHRIADLKRQLKEAQTVQERELLILADYLVQKEVWIIGGDGWAYDIGFSGLDHLFATGYNVNILVLDTEVYSNTGGQQSKATPLGAMAKFASDGKAFLKKDLGKIAMGYEHVYVASIAMGAKDTQTVQALIEASSYEGPSLVIAYSHCIAHGYNLRLGMEQQKLAVSTGYWPLYRYDPRRAKENKPLLRLDSLPPKQPLCNYMEGELRFRMLMESAPKRAYAMMEMMQEHIHKRYAYYQALAKTLPKEELVVS